MPDLSGTILEGKYELIRLVGEGGMGAVYEAKHKLIGRRLAVKFLHSQYTTNEEVVLRFQREAQAAAAIGHENIIEVTDMGQTNDGAPFLVMEFLDGCDVRHLLKRSGALSIEEASEIMVQSLSALEAAHRAGIIHRDLKPENIFLIEKFECKRFVKLLDFGISKFRTLDEGTQGLTQTGTVLGTPYYMSPEQANGSGEIGIKSDIYSMGVILFQMLTGRLPFEAPNYNALLVKILTEAPPDPLDYKPDLPQEIVSIIRCAMAKDTSVRFSTCAEFRERLLSYVPGASSRFQTKMSGSGTAIQSTLSTHTPLEMTRSRGPSQARKGKLPWLIGTAATLVAGFVFALFLFNDPDKKPHFGSTRMDLTIESPNPGISGGSSATSQPQGPKDNKPKQIRLRINASPPEAKIAVDGVISQNPYDKNVYKDDQNHKIDISAKGYRILTADVVFNRDQELTFELQKLGSEGEAPAAEVDEIAPPRNQDKSEKVHTQKKWNGKKNKVKKHRNEKKTDATKAETDKVESVPTPNPTPPPVDAPPADENKKKRRQIDLKDPWKDSQL